jgi:prophage antirepressor-like protein
MCELITVSGVRGYIDENGTAQLNLEDVARGLGFTTTTNGTEYIRWPRVNEYLSDLGFATSGKSPEFIPENIFYRLAMKAKNETAEAFQAKVADDILPSIRKHGAYITPQKVEEILNDPDTIIQLANTVKAERAKRKAAEVECDRKQKMIDGLTAGINLEQKRQILNKVIRRDPAHIRDRWHALYAQFEAIHHINIEQRMDNYIREGGKVQNKLDYVEKRLGMLDELYAIAVKLFETDVTEVRNELFPVA